VTARARRAGAGQELGEAAELRGDQSLQLAWGERAVAKRFSKSAIRLRGSMLFIACTGFTAR
jgi:hypothetical protein